MKFQMQNRREESWGFFSEQQNKATLYPYGMTSPRGGNYPSLTPTDAKQYTQRVPRVAEYLYQCTGTEATGDIVQLALSGPDQKWKKGMTVDAARIEFFVETDPGTTFTVHVGDLDTAAASAAYPNGDAYAVAHVASDADRYVASLALGSVGRVLATSGAGVAQAIPHVLQVDCFLTMTLATVLTPSAAGVIRIRIPYFEL